MEATKQRSNEATKQRSGRRGKKGITVEVLPQHVTHHYDSLL